MELDGALMERATAAHVAKMREMHPSSGHERPAEPGTPRPLRLVPAADELLAYYGEQAIDLLVRTMGEVREQTHAGMPGATTRLRHLVEELRQWNAAAVGART